MQRVEANPTLTLSKRNFVVLFNLDCSGSMSGSRWRRVCEAVRNFVAHLKEDDLVGGVIFNDQFHLLTSPLEQGNIPQKKKEEIERMAQQQKAKKEDCVIF